MTVRPPVLVSACPLGEAVRHDGAEQARQQLLAQGVCVAVLKAGSPSCGSTDIHDGDFQGRRVPGQGVTAALRQQLGVPVFDETQFDAADAVLRQQSLAGPR